MKCNWKSSLPALMITLAAVAAMPAVAQEPAGPGPPPMQEPALAPPPVQDYVPRRYREQDAPTPIRLPVSPTIPANYFVGKWGQVSFNTEDDIPKMRRIAREYCGPLAVTIGAVTPSTFSIYVMTDLKEAQVYEQNDSFYIIPVEQLSDGVIRNARELRVLDNNAFTLRYLEDEAHRRYGPNLFVRCGSKDPKEPGSEKAPPKRKKKARGKVQPQTPSAQ